MKILYLLSFMVLAVLFTSGQTHGAPPQDGESLHVKFYPNPATSAINFEFLKEIDKPYTFQIFNFMGRKVFESSSVNAKTIVNLTDFTRGIYIFQLKDPNGKVIESGKFQVNK